MRPLADKIRPSVLSEFIGQSHLVGPGQPLRAAIEKKHVFSFILWGPPGVGKTTLARIYASALGAEFIELSAVSAGKKDIASILAERGSLLPPPVLFLDEIHRFNKAQQDFLLPHVESGKLVLVGATTENPSFEVIAPLLSRLRVFTLKELSSVELGQIIDRAGIPIPADARDWLIAAADGDARQALTILENTQKLYQQITVDNLKAAAQTHLLRYDKGGEEHYNLISAYIKSMRAGQPDAALYYLARMLEAGEDPKFIARRMVIFASEDVGLGGPAALMVANDVFRAVEIIGLPEAAINLAHGTAYLAGAPKDRRAYDAYQSALADVKKFGSLPVPLKIRNAPTKLMKDLNYGRGYQKYDTDNYLPDALRGHHYLKQENK